MPKRTKGRMRETWRDWAAPNAPDPGMLLTRDEFVQQLQSEGVDATEQDLLYWQKIGVIPYPELKRVGRVGYAYYPFWMVEIIRFLRQLQEDGSTLAAMTDQLRERARMVSALEQWRPSQSPTSRRFLPGRLQPAVVDMARIYFAITGAKVTSIAYRIEDEDGQALEQHVSLPTLPALETEYHDPFDS